MRLCKCTLKYYTTRIKKVETQEKKERKREKNGYKWQSPGAFFVQRRKHHTEAMERNKSSCDRRPTCPTALLLVLHVTKSQVAIPHIYKFLLGVSRSRSPKPFLLHSTHPYFPLSLTFFISVYFPLFPSFPSYSVVVSFPHTFCI